LECPSFAFHTPHSITLHSDLFNANAPILLASG
jgi:hypothetical protein